LFLFLAGLASVSVAQTKPSDAAAPSWAMKMRIFEVPGKGPGEPVKAVTSSYLKYSLTATIKTEFDLAEEMKQIQKTFNYQDVKLLTEADFSWKRNERDKQFHIFRLDGLEYLILITPVDVLRKLTFRIEVNEQGEKAKVNLLDTEFSIPERNITVFGFEDTKGNTYFLSFRVTGWKQAAYLPGLGTEATPYIIPAEGPVRALGEINPPRVKKMIYPVYPEVARTAKVEGVVILEAETDIYGRVQNLKVLRSVPLLDQAAIDCVRQWVYEPFKIDNKPRGVIFTVTVRFALDGGGGKAAPPAKEGDPLKLTGDVKGPKLITQVNPVYPEAARKSRVEGKVILEVTTDIYGRVRDIKVLRSIPLLDQAALDAVRQWVFEPPIINGKPISVTFTVPMTFTLK
jgi:TonB family protein